MKFISLFAGIGGFDLGFERAGMECVAQVEIDPFCQKVLTKHWPDVPKFGDIRNVGKHNLPQADVIIGGFPCQPHSRAGKQAGEKDDRNLWPEMFRVISEINPTWIVGENVTGIKDTILDKVLADLESLNYETAPLIIPACAFDAPHIRKRVFILSWNVADTKGRGCGFSHSQNIGTPYRESNPPPNSGEVLASGEGTPWQAEPTVGRVADGVPNWMDRIRSLGNAVVPQVAEFIARSILQVESVPNTAWSMTGLHPEEERRKKSKSTCANDSQGEQRPAAHA